VFFTKKNILIILAPLYAHALCWFFVCMSVLSNRPLELVRFSSSIVLILLIVSIASNIFLLIYFRGKYKNMKATVLLLFYGCINGVCLFPAYLVYSTAISGHLM
jgi:FtsH-binding integral membrane protein